MQLLVNLYCIPLRFEKSKDKCIHMKYKGTKHNYTRYNVQDKASFFDLNPDNIFDGCNRVFRTRTVYNFMRSEYSLLLENIIDMTATKTVTGHYICFLKWTNIQI
ncbi:hypothetical protein CLU79DRAFT_420342 [Phycomyces nitens]|nr:hypothetical protein CLU79DRAFT_420342 [Phycomyces nitens]